MTPSPKAARCLTLIASPAAATTLVVASVSTRAVPSKSKEMSALLSLNLTDEEIAEIEGRNIYQPGLVTAA